jgi:hypothetical protein
MYEWWLLPEYEYCVWKDESMQRAVEAFISANGRSPRDCVWIVGTSSAAICAWNNIILGIPNSKPQFHECFAQELTRTSCIRWQLCGLFLATSKESGLSRRHPRCGANETGVTWLAGHNSLWRLMCVCSGEKTSRCCSWSRPFNSRPSLLLHPSRVLIHICSSLILNALLFILEECLFWGRSSFAQKQHHLDQLDHSKWVDLPKLWCRFILPTALLSIRWYEEYYFEVVSQSSCLYPLVSMLPWSRQDVISSNGTRLCSSFSLDFDSWHLIFTLHQNLLRMAWSQKDQIFADTKSVQSFYVTPTQHTRIGAFVSSHS